MQRIQYGDVPRPLLEELYDRLATVVIEWAEEHHVGGLSAATEWNIYNGLEEAVFAAKEQEKRRHET
jgi:hypothetical protein